MQDSFRARGRRDRLGSEPKLARGLGALCDGGGDLIFAIVLTAGSHPDAVAYALGTELYPARVWSLDHMLATVS